jgi:hypothetical protein
MEYTDAELFEIGYNIGKYERSRVAHNVSRPMDTKTERRTPMQGRREVVPRSRPRDAGKTIRYRWKKDLSAASPAYQEGYAKGYAETPALPLFSPDAPVTYGDFSEIPTTLQMQEKLPDPEVRAGMLQTMQSFKTGSTREYQEGMFTELDELCRKFLSGKLKHIDAGFIQGFADRWHIPVLEAKQRLEREFNR